MSDSQDRKDKHRALRAVRDDGSMLGGMVGCTGERPTTASRDGDQRPSWCAADRTECRIVTIIIALALTRALRDFMSGLSISEYLDRSFTSIDFDG
jgi:hypothetical protein